MPPDIPACFADIDGDGSPDEFFAGLPDEPNYTGMRNIEDVQQPFRFVLEGVYRSLLKESHEQFIK